jgi:ankyrin repeat protein
MQVSPRFEAVSSPKSTTSSANARSKPAFQSAAEQPKDQVTFSGRKDKIEREQEAQAEDAFLVGDALSIVMLHQPILADFLAREEGGEEIDSLALEFLKMDAPPNMKGTELGGKAFGVPPLVLATQSGRHDVMEALIRAGADPNVKVDRDQMSALLSAVLKEDADAFNFLLENGANPEAKDAEGNTPLSEAVFLEQTDFVRKMLDLGANPDVKVPMNGSLLFTAARCKNAEIAQLILEMGGNPNIQNAHGETPLTVAVKTNNFRMARLLLKHGANPSLPDHDGFTPLNNVAIYGRRDMRALFN